MNEKIQGSILGFAVADALGVPVEFLDRSQLIDKPVTDMEGFGSHRVPEGTWSDDTSLMLATMDSIVEKNGIDYDNIMQKFFNWVTKNEYTATGELFDIGISTKKAIMNYYSGMPALECGCTGFNENGNGSLMRMTPLVFYLYQNFSRKEIISIINNISSLTHAHEISKLGCAIYVDYMIKILDGNSKEEAYEALKKINYSEYYSEESIKLYSRILNGNLPNLDINQIKSSGFVVDTLEAAIWCTLKNTSYKDSVLAAVNLGNDTDTIGAITGSINGLIYGRSAIPMEWLIKMKNFPYLESLINNFSKQ